MIEVLLNGFLIGLGMSLMLGTVFFSLIQNSIQHGWNKGVLIAFGVVISDILFITLAVLGVQFLDPDSGNVWLQTGAIALLGLLGINLMLNRKPVIAYPDSRLGKAMYFISNGFLLNFLNPVNFLAWAALATLARTEWQYGNAELNLFFAACMIAIFASEVVISVLAHQIRRYLNERVLVWVNRITGMIFLGIALYLVYTFFFGD